MLGRRLRAFFRVAALFLATNFVASTAAQSTGFRPEPAIDQRSQVRPEFMLSDRWPRTTTPPSPAIVARAEDSRISVRWTDSPNWADTRLGTTARTHWSERLATSTEAVKRSEPANKVSTFPLEPSTVFAELCASMTRCAEWFSTSPRLAQSEAPRSNLPADGDGSKHGDASKPTVKIEPPSKPIEFNQTVYYRNKTEFGLDIGWLPVNIPFPFDILLGDGYNNPPLYYTLVPILASIRWQTGDVKGSWIFRGNWDLQTSLGIVPIPRGAETYYFSWIVGFRRNFVPHRGKIAPYFDYRIGMGRIDAKEPLGVLFAQGQDFTFTMNLGSGVRYNFNQKYSISAGLNWMHISNAYLSEPKFPDYGINVYGPMLGIDVRLGKPHRNASE
jgi:hypothetical protein